MNNENVGYCGLYCGGCKIYQSTISGKPEIDENNKPIYCDGCASSRLTGWCSTCKIKECNQKKGIRFCIECNLNPCEMLIAFMNDSKYPYHQEIQKDMKSIKELGVIKWIKIKDKQYHCKKCNNLINWFETKCSQCDENI